MRLKKTRDGNLSEMISHRDVAHGDISDGPEKN